MRQTAEHRSYIGSRAVLSRHGRVPVPRISAAGARKGFTLVELVVAFAILMILLVSLMGSFAASVAGFKRSQEMTFAQNLAEFTVEDMKGMGPGTLNSIVLDADSNINYLGANEIGSPVGDPSNPLHDATAVANDALPWMYDSGSVGTDFVVLDIRSLPGDPTYVAGGTTPPPLPRNSLLLLGDNTTVSVVSVATPSGNLWYYEVTFHHSDYKLMRKRVQIAMYDGSMDTASYSRWSPSTPTSYRQVTDETKTAFAYRVTIYSVAGSSQSVLYQTEGTIMFPYS